MLKYSLSESIPKSRRADVDRIQEVLWGAGYIVTDYEAYFYWDEYSDSMSAGWIILPDNDEDIVRTLTVMVEDED